MSQSKKYDYQIEQHDSNWRVKIIRRVTSKRTTVSKSQEGFSSEAEAEAWGKKELAQFLDNLVQRNKRRAMNRK